MPLNYQNITNNRVQSKINNAYYNWQCDEINPDWTHRDIYINDFGNPVLKLYLDETKRLYKKISTNNIDTTDYVIGKNDGIISYSDICEYDKNQVSIIAKNVGQCIIKATDIPDFYDVNIEDIDLTFVKDLIVVVEPKPTMISIDWHNDIEAIPETGMITNPYKVEDYINMIKLNFKVTYSNGDIKIQDDNILFDQLHITDRTCCHFEFHVLHFSSEFHENYIIFKEFDENHELYGVKVPEMLRVYRGDISIKTKFIYDLVPEPIIYNNELSNHTIFYLYKCYEDKNGNLYEFTHDVENSKIIKNGYIYELMSKCVYQCSDNLFASNGVITVTNRIDKLPYTGWMKLTCPDIDLDFYNNQNDLNLPLTELNELIYRIYITKEIKHIRYYSSHNRMNVGDNALLYVEVRYTDDTFVHIANECEFKIDNLHVEAIGKEVIRIDKYSLEVYPEHETTSAIIVGLYGGKATISVILPFKYDGEIINDLQTFEVIQPITNIKLNKKYIELDIGDSTDLKYTFIPENASPSINLDWITRDESIVELTNSHDYSATFKAINEGETEIFISVMNPASYNPYQNDIKTISEYIYLLPKGLLLEGKINASNETDIIYKDSLLYKVTMSNDSLNLYKIFFKTKSDINDELYNEKYDLTEEEQEINIYIPNDFKIQYDKFMKIKVTNSFDELVGHMKINTFKCPIVNEKLDINHPSESIITYTDEIGMSNIISFDSKNTDKDGHCEVNGIEVQVQLSNEAVENAEVSYYDINKLYIKLPDNINKDDILTTKKLLIGVFDKVKYNQNILQRISNIRVKVYLHDDIIFDGISDKDGFIRITTAYNIIDKDEDGQVNIDLSEKLNFIKYNPTLCASCTIVSKLVTVKSIDIPSTYTLNLDERPVEILTTVTPENATKQDLLYKVEDENVAKITTGNYIYGYKLGETKLTVSSISNPEISATATVTVTSNRLQSVKIGTGNDTSDHEWYDDLNDKKLSIYENVDSISPYKKITNEKYDDDDFSRFYVPVNNSLQIPFSIIPTDAFDTNLKWLSSDSNLVRVSKEGIVTGIREGKQQLDVYNEDDVSETRFANTAWVTAINTKYNKYDVCQVRVIQNKITNINIATTTEHDIDIDDVNSDGKYNSKSEHEFDYIMNVGDTIKIPVTLTVQDSAFGPSNYLKWSISHSEPGLNEVVELSGGSPDHNNAWDENFDWSHKNPSGVNSNKLRPTLTVKAVGLGDVEFYATAYDNNDEKSKVYMSETTVTAVTTGDGYVTLNSSVNSNEFKLSVDILYSNKLLNNFIRREYKVLAAQCERIYTYYIQSLLYEHVKGTDEPDPLPETLEYVDGCLLSIDKNGKCCIKKDGVLLMCDGIMVEREKLYDVSYFDNHFISVKGAKLTLTPDKRLHIVMPEVCEIKNLYTLPNDENKNPQGLPISFTFKPIVQQYVDENYEKNGEIKIKCFNGFPDTKLERIGKTPVYLNADVIYETDYSILNSLEMSTERTTMLALGNALSFYDNNEVYNYFIEEIKFPTDTTAHEDFDIEDFYSNNSRLVPVPGTGSYLKDDNGEFVHIESRKVRIRVVATPTKLEIGWCNIWNEDNGKLPPLQKIDSDTTTMERSNERKHRYMMIGFDDDFNYLLDEAMYNTNYELEEKYRSFAWFSDNENVVKFKDVEYIMSYDEEGNYKPELAYRDKNGELTNNINEVVYTDHMNKQITGSKIGKTDFVVRSSRIKEVICEEKGTANVYIVSPKGQAIRRLKIIID